MRLSQLFTKSRKTVPADEPAKNAQLLIKAGFIHKEMAGVYTFLPLGLRVLNNIAKIIREEMDAAGGQEVLMPALQVKERYETTNRWDDEAVDIWFKTKLANDTEVGLGFSHEENLVPLVKNFVSSYKDMPFAVYQIQTKFRNELRPKSGLMRGREFMMKDMYSFALTKKQHDDFYAQMQKVYKKTFDRLGIGKQTVMTFASGGSFSKYSHEYQTISDVGEDTIYVDQKKNIAINKEVLTDEVLKELKIDRSNLKECRGIEVGNIFSLDTKFSKPFKLTVADENGQDQTVIMGCYGIGLSRVMGAIVEILSDEKGLVWPENIAPAKVIIIRLGDNDKVIKAADNLYKDLTQKSVEVIYDDRDLHAGEKFADADLTGIPYRVVISEKTLANNEQYEIKARTSDTVQMTNIEGVLKIVSSRK